MTSRRDWLLQQMGITQYQLRRPRVLQGEIAVRLLPDTQLIIVAENPPGLQEPFLRDVLHTLGLKPTQVMTVTPDQLQMLPETLNCAGWLLGVESEQSFNGVALSSASFNELLSSGAARRALWQQMCEHDSHFFSHA
ncbi:MULTISPECIES: DNA polymerase III subunit psi [Pantoea]|uniref:DNA polymerase III subunit psi n=2 Tax=Pantoea stewartii TaxID=66269 RepID=H3RJY6_PANSE|nr:MULTISPECIES: DNA polymerase III subunit psi [Pantoea]ARF48670.1 DNA polymerase III subunit psi [Pantoea stewartii subsp. stewartii DC283]EHT98593.1 DNA polymerase III psi subunit [Pantoea stewartii subsp. stewartii DC283]KAB0547346.1 DNA polymerase III subunit psi [Pantoea stewartii subsp. stewartii]KGD83205.1 DNA polymerase III subunit psi [Pantoea stewartii subsp. indologenes]KHE01743.1 DNA polymerase III subunit psi [Pantoea stewartii]